MKLLIVILPILFLIACGTKPESTNCHVETTNEGSTITCPDGSTSIIRNGKDGTNGQPCTIEALSEGVQVTCSETVLVVKNGIDATPVVPIKFCKEEPKYPSTFPEYGLLMNGHIYAVYSANGGFFTIIPPGRYSSNAIGSVCSFTVNEDNTITED